MEWNRHVGTELGPTLRAWRSAVLDLPSFFQQPLLSSPSHWEKPQLLVEWAHTPSSPLLPSFPGHRVWSSWWFLQTLVMLVPRDLCLIHVVMWSAPIGQTFWNSTKHIKLPSCIIIIPHQGVGCEKEMDCHTMHSGTIYLAIHFKIEQGFPSVVSEVLDGIYKNM